jgi:putative Mn2+ efflux pump MntP
MWVYNKIMNIFKTFTMNWWQIGIFKLSLASIGIILGVYFQEFFIKYILLVGIIFVLSTLYTLILWLRQ